MAHSFLRRKNKRQPYDRVLITCEGKATEPNYFNDLRSDGNLASANVVVTGQSNSDPLSVVNYGTKLFQDDGDYDRLYCVFDGDRAGTQNFNQALQRIRQLKKEGVRARCIVSYPCFEYWLLIHFTCTGKRYAAAAGSACKDVEKDLKREMTNYAKTRKDLYTTLKDRLSEALDCAKQRRGQKPRTNVDVLVKYLRGIRKK